MVLLEDVLTLPSPGTPPTDFELMSTMMQKLAQLEIKAKAQALDIRRKARFLRGQTHNTHRPHPHPKQTPKNRFHTSTTTTSFMLHLQNPIKNMHADKPQCHKLQHRIRSFTEHVVLRHSRATHNVWSLHNFTQPSHDDDDDDNDMCVLWLPFFSTKRKKQ